MILFLGGLALDAIYCYNIAHGKEYYPSCVSLHALWWFVVPPQGGETQALRKVRHAILGCAKEMKPNRITRAYTLTIEANPGKAEQARYACYWYRAYTLDYCAKYFAQGPTEKRQAESTASLGWLANQAQQRARGIINAGFAAEKANGNQFKCPTDFPLFCDAKIQEAKSTSYTYWVKPPTCPAMPTQTHRALKNALRRGGKLRPTCEVRHGKRGRLVARVFVEFPKVKPVLSPEVLACDVGVNIGVARSDGYKSKPLRPVLNQATARKAARQKQGHRKKSNRTMVKQLLDREARKAVTLAARTGKVLVIEACKPLANLKPLGSIGGWPRQHFGARCLQIAEEVGVFVWEQWPARSSITCPPCGYCDKANRQGEAFRCVGCGFVGHADTVASINLARWARGKIRLYLEKAARKKHDSHHRLITVPLGGVEKS